MSVRRSFSISMAEKYASIVIQLAGSMIVARLLSPAEFGIFSLAMSVSILAQVFRDLGIGQYLIQEKSLTQDKIRAAQAILMTASFSLGTLVILSADTAANFYQEPKIIPLLWMLGANFFLLPVGAVTFALWRRELQFGRIAIIAIVATLTNTLTTITLAYKGYSFLSLGWGTLAGSLITAALCVLYRPKNTHYLPGLRGIKGVLHYSSLATFNSLLETLSERSPTLILGKTAGMEVVGLYERAIGLAEIFNRLLMQAVWSISTPILADKIRTGQDVKADYIKATSLITTAGFVFMIWLAIIAEPLILILFGDQWGNAAPLVQLICIRTMISMPNYLSSSLIIGHGNIYVLTKITIITRGGTILGAAWGSQWGVEGVLIGMIISSTIGAGWIFYCIRPYASPRDLAITSIKSLIPAALLGITMIIFMQFSNGTTLATWTLATAIGIIVWSISLWVLKNPIINELNNIIHTRLINNKI